MKKLDNIIELWNAVLQEISGNVSKICSYAFASCSGLKNFVINANVTEIGNYAFDECEALESVTIAEGCTQLGEYVFS